MFSKNELTNLEYSFFSILATEEYILNTPVRQQNVCKLFYRF